MENFWQRKPYTNGSIGGVHPRPHSPLSQPRPQSPLSQPRIARADEGFHSPSSRQSLVDRALAFVPNLLQSVIYGRSSSQECAYIRQSSPYRQSGIGNSSPENGGGTSALQHQRWMIEENRLDSNDIKSASSASRDLQAQGKVGSDLQKLELEVNFALNRRALAYCIGTVSLDVLLLTITQQENYLVFLKLMGSRLFLIFFIFTEQVKQMGSTPFDLLSFLKFRYFGDIYSTTLSATQIFAFILVTETFDAMIGRPWQFTSAQEEFYQILKVFLAFAYQFEMCTNKRINRFRPAITYINLPLEFGKESLKYFQYFFRTFACIWAMSIVLTLLRFVEIGDVALFASSTQPWTPELRAKLEITDFFSPSLVVYAANIFCFTFSLNTYSAILLWYFQSVTMDFLIETKNHRGEALNFSIYTDLPDVKDGKARARTIVDYHCLNNLERYANIAGEVIRNVENRYSALGQLQTTDRSWEIFCKYTSDNMRFMIDLVNQRPISEQGEREFGQSMGQTLKYGVETWDNFVNHAKLASKERIFAIAVANRGDLLLQNLRVLSLFMDKIRASIKADSLLSAPLVQEMLKHINEASLQLTDFVPPRSRDQAEGRRFSYSVSIRMNLQRFVCAFRREAQAVAM